MVATKLPAKTSLLIKSLGDEINRLESLPETKAMFVSVFNCLNWWHSMKSTLPVGLHITTQNTIKALEDRLRVLIDRFHANDHTMVNPGQSMVVFQVPEPHDLLALKGAMTGTEDDQKFRITRMIDTLRSLNLQPSMITDTSHYHEGYVNPMPWQLVFNAIQSGNKSCAVDFFNCIPASDPLLKAILSCHSIEYIKHLILQCAGLKAGKTASFGPDLVGNSRTFEVLIKDLMTTINSVGTIGLVNVNFSLPTHHAHHDAGAGFCFLNKLAILTAYEVLISPFPLSCFSLGLDINADDGVARALFDLSLLTEHVDIQDSRVYPHPDFDSLNQDLGVAGQVVYPGSYQWSKLNHRYNVLDLAVLKRDGEGIHPVLISALQQLNNHLHQALLSEYNVVLCLPIGWDSHRNETAPCGNFINNQRTLTAQESFQHRFTDEDFDFFYEQLATSIKFYSSVIHRVYWQLEGGYTPEVYTRQIQRMAPIFGQLAINLAEDFMPGSNSNLVG